MPSGFLGGGIGPVALKRRRAASGNGLLNNLIAYWPLNEAGGANNALDLHSNALTLTQVASPGSDTGKVHAGARTFNGSTQYFSRASEALLQTGDVDFTIAAWVYLGSKSAAVCPIISKDQAAAGGKREYLVYYDNATDRLRAIVWRATDTASNVQANSYGSPALNTWLCVFVWHDATADTINIAINNGSIDSLATGGALQVASNAIFAIGSRSTNSFTEKFPGRIGPVAMWKSAPGGGGVLTAAQRTALWNGGAGLAYANFTA